MFRRTTIVLAMVVFPLAGTAQTAPSLTLAAAIARAQSAAFDVRISLADRDIAAARVAAARAQLLPQIGVSGTTMNGGIAQLGMPVAQQTYLSATASVPLFVPSNASTERAMSSAARASAFDSLRARNDAAFLATQAYERAMLAQAVVASRMVTVDYQTRRAADVDVRVRAGALPRYQRAQARGALAEAMHMLEDARAERDEAVADLEVVLDMPITPSLVLADALEPLPLIGTLADFQRRSAAQRPELLAATEQLRAAQAGVAAARDRYLPNVVGSAQTYTGRSNPALGSHGYQLGVTATLPILDGGARAAASSEAEAEVERAQIVLEQAQRSTERDVANAWREYLAARHNLVSARIESEASAEELRVVSLRERAGKGIALETLSALSDDAKARESNLLAIARLNDAVAGLRHAAGDPLTP